MTNPKSDLEARADLFSNVTLDAVEQARDLATRTAQQMDAGEFGIDAITRSMSQFFDIIARGSAAHFTTAIAGPCFSVGTDAIPVVEEVILEQAKDYPRQISIDKPFKDIARPDVIIPNYSVVLEPPLVVPANAKMFTLKVRLKDTQYIGRNYTAKLAFTEIGEHSLVRRDYQDVTVAL